MSKLTTRSALQVRFKGQRLARISESYAGLNAPRPVLRAVSAGAAVVVAEAALKVIGHANVVTVGLNLADKNVDVFELSLGWHAKP